MQVITPITLDLTRPGFPPPVDAKQGDSTRYILAYITDNGVPWTIPDGVIGIVGVQKPDGKECWYEYLSDGSPAVTFAGSAATFALAPAALEAAGEAFADVSLYNADQQKLTTFGFRLHIERAAATENEITGSDYYNVLTKEIAAVLDAAQSIAGLQVTYDVLPAGSAPSVAPEWEDKELTLHFELVPGPQGDIGPTGPQGKQGPRGEKGAHGTVVELTGSIFALHISDEGDLILTVADDATPPPLSIDENGDLIYTIE